ncbi:MAG TPA: YidC/Oxa1 family membrane protein insertase, partial [Egibacteraceae bacterium]
MEIWRTLLEGLEAILRFFHGLAEPLFGAAAWGWAIVLLTLTVRVLLLPLAVKQTNSMRAMQKLQPEMKRIQAKYKVDRSLMRTNPEKYQQQRQKQQEAMMALY